MALLEDLDVRTESIQRRSSYVLHHYLEIFRPGRDYLEIIWSGCDYLEIIRLGGDYPEIIRRFYFPFAACLLACLLAGWLAGWLARLLSQGLLREMLGLVWVILTRLGLNNPRCETIPQIKS